MNQESELEVEAGEQPLVCFVSSVMRPEIQWARDATVNALRENQWVSWAFEYTPASSSSPDRSYLTKVHQADFVIWLVGADTTTPVIDEINEALARERKILMILLPAKLRSGDTDNMIKKVESRVKYGHAHDAASLRTLIVLTFGDEVVRAIRGKPDLTRKAALDQAIRASRERMIVRWVAAGLSQVEAIDICEDLTLSEVPPIVIPSAVYPMRIVIGNVGAGKSIIAERVFQRAARYALENVNAPIPIFLHSRNCQGSLEQNVVSAASTSGNPRVQGAFVVIDGLDEVSRSQARNIVEEAKVLAASLPNQSCILMTSRPSDVVNGGPNSILLPRLSENETVALMQKVLGRPPGRWPAHLNEILTLPLFAILYAMELREQSINTLPEGNLLKVLVEKAIDRDRDAIALGFDLLQKLAVRSMEANGSPIPVGELGTFVDRNSVVKSHIVVESQDEIGFGLPIFTQWFAAQSLMSGRPLLDSLISDPQRLDRWRSAIAIAISSGSREFVNMFLGQLAREDPGFTADILGEALRPWASDSSAIQRNWADIGKEIRGGFESWTNGIAPLDELILPQIFPSDLYAVAIDVADGWVNWGWHDRSEQDADVVPFPEDVTFVQSRPGWKMSRSVRWNDAPGRAWLFSQAVLRDELKSLIERKALPTDDPGLLKEAVWLYSFKSNEWIVDSGQVVLEPILEELRTFPANQLLRCYDRYAQAGLIRDFIQGQLNSGVEFLGPLWPRPDQTASGNHIWGEYSEVRQVERTEAVLAAAINAYESVVRTWFPRLGLRMTTMAILPARLVGEYQSGVEDPYRTPGLQWHWEPLPLTEKSTVEISIARTSNDDISWERIQSLLGENQRIVAKFRPGFATWLGVPLTSLNASIFFHQAPVGEIVYDWLKNDLRRINWYS